ncbi:hypothetical protein KIL84_015877 [Mauremys mutica]|uniref:Uncharacterized protein n=1 Tax=Mauremys mutica TaxID=74926 RepID=A0A9D3WTX6_9SAUR|nr:hypothetical protein KIL84_015877 [Mauremys mutica]
MLGWPMLSTCTDKEAQGRRYGFEFCSSGTGLTHSYLVMFEYTAKPTACASVVSSPRPTHSLMVGINEGRIWPCLDLKKKQVPRKRQNCKCTDVVKYNPST